MPRDISSALNNSLLIILTICFFSITACSTTGDKNIFIPYPAEPAMAAVYLYRPTVISNAIYTPDLYINGEYKFTTQSGKNTRLLLNPGEYTFELETNKQFSGLTRLSLNLVSGTTYFIRMDTTLKIDSATNYKPYQRSFSLVEIDAISAISDISKCCMKEDDNTSNITEKSSSGETRRDEFSVDKTQNPFSH